MHNAGLYFCYIKEENPIQITLVSLTYLSDLSSKFRLFPDCQQFHVTFVHLQRTPECNLTYCIKQLTKKPNLFHFIQLILVLKVAKFADDTKSGWKVSLQKWNEVPKWVDKEVVHGVEHGKCEIVYLGRKTKMLWVFRKSLPQRAVKLFSKPGIIDSCETRGWKVSTR